MDLLVDESEAAALVAADATVLDTRGRLAYLWGHVPGAVSVSWRIGTTGGLLSGELDAPEVVADAFEQLGVRDDRPVLVVGAWAEGWGEEGRIAWDLSWLGHPDVHVLRGGMDTWTGPTEHFAPAIRPGRFTPRPVEKLRTDRAGAQVAPLIVDVREPDEYAGARRFGESRGGHLPAAQNVPWRSLLEAPPSLPRDTPIVVYCTGGVRSGMAWLMLRAWGYEDVANYDASFWDYARSSEVLADP